MGQHFWKWGGRWGGGAAVLALPGPLLYFGRFRKTALQEGRAGRPASGRRGHLAVQGKRAPGSRLRARPAKQGFLPQPSGFPFPPAGRGRWAFLRGTRKGSGHRDSLVPGTRPDRSGRAPNPGQSPPRPLPGRPSPIGSPRLSPQT